MDAGKDSAFFREEKNMFDMQKVGERIAALRKKTGMTQAELAEWLGISYQAVSSWERGATMPDISKLVELSRALHTTVDALLSGEKMPEEQADAETENVKTEEQPTGVPDDDLQDMMARLGSNLRDQMDELCDNLQELKKQFAGEVTIAKKGGNNYIVHFPDEEETAARGKVNADVIGAMAWNMDQETLEDVLVDAVNDGDDETVEEIACYLESETIDRAMARAAEALTLEMAESLACFMSSAALEECVVRAIDEGDDDIVEACAAHLEDEALERVLSRCTGELTIDMVEALSSHASEAALDILIEKCDLEDEDVIETLSSYLNQRQIRALLKRLRNG